MARIKIASALDFIFRRPTDRKRAAAAFSGALVVGTALAWLVSLVYPLLSGPKNILQLYLKSNLPAHSFAEAIVALICFLLMGLILALPWKWWRSLRLGFIGFGYWAWVVSVLAFWILLDAHYPRLGLVMLVSAAILSLVMNSVCRGSSAQISASQVSEADLPVPENGEDLLGRRDAIDDLVSKILFERPVVIAVTGSYGEGKTSFLNLTVGELKKVDQEACPVIVRFSPWLAADSNTLVLSLLNSIVAEVKAKYLVPGLSRDRSPILLRLTAFGKRSFNAQRIMSARLG